MGQKKQIAIVTGATGGIGREFVRLLQGEGLQEIWIIGRNRERLGQLKSRYGDQVIPLCLDVTAPGALQSIQELLTEEVQISREWSAPRGLPKKP